MKKIISDFRPQGGKHCITSSLKQIFHYYGYPLSEEMIFGLGAGLSFLYLNQSSSPMICGRTKVFEFEKKLAQRLSMTIQCHAGKDQDRIRAKTRALIDRNQPVLIYVDMPYLEYLKLPESAHFGGHAVVLFGYDDDQRRFYISDRDQHDSPIPIPGGISAEDVHLVSYEQLEKARSSSFPPFPANNQYLTFDFSGIAEIDKTMIKSAVKETCEAMLNAPAQLLGLNGIRKFAKEILKWEAFSLAKQRRSVETNYFQISADGGTGGGLFRKMYGQFLIEASMIAEDERLAELGRQFVETAADWDRLADMLRQLTETDVNRQLQTASALVSELHKTETRLFNELYSLV